MVQLLTGREVLFYGVDRYALFGFLPGVEEYGVARVEQVYEDHPGSSK